MTCKRCNLLNTTSHSRAGGKGTAGMAMAVPVFEGEKWHRLDSNVCLRYRMASPSGRRSLGRLGGLLRTFSSLQASKVSTRELRLINFLWRYLARDERANWGGANMGVVRSGHFWQLGSFASLATETTGGEILVAFWPKHGLRSDLRVPNFKNFYF